MSPALHYAKYSFLPKNLNLAVWMDKRVGAELETDVEYYHDKKNVRKRAVFNFRGRLHAS